MSDVYESIGEWGYVRRPEYDPDTGAASGPEARIKLGAARKDFVKDTDGSFTFQPSIIHLSERLLRAAGFPTPPVASDTVEAGGVLYVIRHVREVGDPDDIIYYCQCEG